jgi:hypothetical protein
MLALEQNVNLFNHRTSFLKTKNPVVIGGCACLRQLVAGAWNTYSVVILLPPEFTIGR